MQEKATQPTIQVNVVPSALTVLVMCLAISGLPALACFYQGDMVTGIVLLAIGISCFLGFRVGAVRSLSAFAGFVAAVYFATSYGPELGQLLTDWTGASAFVCRALSFGAIGLGALAICGSLGSLIYRRLLPAGSFRNLLDRCGGLLLFGAEATFGIAIFLAAITMLVPENRVPRPPAENARFNTRMQYQLSVVAAAIRKSAVGGFVGKQNLPERIPQLRQLKEMQSDIRNRKITRLDATSLEPLLYI